MRREVQVLGRAASRALAIGGKLLLALTIVDRLGEETFAVFAIVQGWAVFGSKILGGGTIYWLQRRAARMAPEVPRILCLVHLLWSCIGYSLAGLVIIAARPYDLFVGPLVLWGILTSEHAVTEMTLLAYYSKSGRGGDAAMVIRNLWPVAGCLYMWGAATPDGDALYRLWIAANVLATGIAVSASGYWRLWTPRRPRRFFTLARVVLKKAAGPLLAVSAYATAVSLDRYVVELTAGLKVAAEYSLFGSAVAAVAALFQSAFTLPLNHTMVDAFRDGTHRRQIAGRRRQLRFLTAMVFAGGLLVLVTAVVSGAVQRFPVGAFPLATGVCAIALGVVRVWHEFESSVDYAGQRDRLLLEVNAAVLGVGLGATACGAVIGEAAGGMVGLMGAFAVASALRVWRRRVKRSGPFERVCIPGTTGWKRMVR